MTHASNLNHRSSQYTLPPNTFITKRFKENPRVIFLRDIVCEAIATFLMVSIQSSLDSSVKGPFLGIIAMGFTIAVLIEIFTPMGGAHMNPAVTIALVVAGKFSVTKAMIYIPVQCVAAIGGSGLIYWLAPVGMRGVLAASQVHPELTVWQGLVCEVWMTTFLVFTVHASGNEARRPVYMNSLVIGSAVLVAGAAGGLYSGPSMNPARSLGPAVVMDIWEHHWVFWVGPITGGLLATVLYVHVFDTIGVPSKGLHICCTKPHEHWPSVLEPRGVNNNAYLQCEMATPDTTYNSPDTTYNSYM